MNQAPLTTREKLARALYMIDGMVWWTDAFPAIYYDKADVLLASGALTDAAKLTALADKWNSTPDYDPTDYDRGRVDQRHDMTAELYEALSAESGEMKQ